MKTIAPVSAVIANSDPRHAQRPPLDLNFLRESIIELIALHMDGKAPAFANCDQVIHDEVVKRLRNPRWRARAETMTSACLILEKINDLLDTIAESS